MQFLKALLTFVFSLVLLPVQVLLRLLGGGRAALAEYRITWSADACHIEARFTSQEHDQATLLIASYLLFVSRYFYSCERSQLDVVRTYLLENVHDFAVNRQMHALALHERVLSTLNAVQRHASSQLFPAGPPGFGDYAPSRPNSPSATYTLRVLDTFGSWLELSSGPHMILLPQFLVVFYSFVVDHLPDRTSTERLDGLVSTLLTMYDRVDPRSTGTMQRAPLEVLREAHVI